MKKKIAICVCSGLLVLLCISVYLLIFRKPEITITQVTITELLKDYESMRDFWSDDEIMDIIPDFMEDAKKYPDIQNMWGDEDLPSYNPQDYAVLSIQFSARNTTIFDSIYKYALINAFDRQAGVAIVSNPLVTPIEIKRLSTTDELEYRMYIYMGDKSKEEIEQFINSIEFQVCFDSKIYKGGSIIVDVENPDITYIRCEE